MQTYMAPFFITVKNGNNSNTHLIGKKQNGVQYILKSIYFSRRLKRKYTAIIINVYVLVEDKKGNIAYKYMKYYSEFFKKEILSFLITWMPINDNMLSKISQ